MLQEETWHLFPRGENVASTFFTWPPPYPQPCLPGITWSPPYHQPCLPGITWPPSHPQPYLPGITWPPSHPQPCLAGTGITWPPSDPQPCLAGITWPPPHPQPCLPVLPGCLLFGRVFIPSPVCQVGHAGQNSHQQVHLKIPAPQISHLKF